MKRFKSEFVHSYATYSFGYSEYAEREREDTLAEIYAEGFLPYTGIRDIKDMLYMARSARVRLADFAPTSENRRILKRFDGTLERTITPLSDFELSDDFLEFCLAYFASRHGAVMPRERLETILNAGFITDIATYTKDSARCAYVFIAQDRSCSHFWFSFYDLHYIRRSLGLWLLLDRARAAQQEGKSHFYLGTVYGEKGLYKTNFPALEYWNGNAWSDDIRTLRALCRADTEHTIAHQDRWKDAQRNRAF